MKTTACAVVFSLAGPNLRNEVHSKPHVCGSVVVGYKTTIDDTWELSSQMLLLIRGQATSNIFAHPDFVQEGAVAGTSLGVLQTD